MKNELGDLMKAWESYEFNWIDPTTHHVYMRLDGRSFHTYVKGLEKPFSTKFRDAMLTATKMTMDEFNIDLGYVQSDEISFGWFPKENPLAEFLFGGRKDKLVSIIPAYFTSIFVEQMITNADFFKPCAFDARAVNFWDNKDIFQKMFYWRYLDAYRNGILTLAQSKMSQKQLHGMSLQDIKTLDWFEEAYDNFKPHFREGTYFVKNKGFPISKQEFVDVFTKGIPERQKLITTA